MSGLTNIQLQQSQLIIQAIDNYLAWRSNKGRPDGRGYVLGLWTRLRHASSFGRNRAETFRNQLATNTTANPLQLLQVHLLSDSRTSNHSLDTYILESIFNNKDLFLQWFTAKSALRGLRRLDSHHRSTLLNIILQSDTSTSRYNIIAKLYEDTTTVANHLQIACDYYGLGLKIGDPVSIAAITRFAKAGNSEAQYLLGVDYYHHKSQVDEAIYWCMLAAESKHAKACDYLNKTTFTVVQYTTIGQKYAEGTGVAKNEESAVAFYKKACALKSKAAALYLGSYYRPNLTIPYNPKAQQAGKNLTESFNYYGVAAEQADTQAMEAMANLTEYANDDALRLRLANLYLDVFANPQLAFKHFKMLADKNNVPAIYQIKASIQKNLQHIAIIAKLYEDDVALKNHMQIACDYYAIGLKNDYTPSLSAILRLAQAGNNEAQYLLGVEHYHKKNKVDEAIHWCMLAAESKHANAITYLNNTTFTVVQYTTIASSYAAGTGVAKNEASAIVFYKKACALKSIAAAMYLGQYYQPNLTVAHNPQTQQTGKNVTDSFNYYCVAAEQGDVQAMEAMAKLTEYANDDALRLRLANLYLNVFANPQLAFKHLKILADKSNSLAINQIKASIQNNPQYLAIIAKLYEEDVALNNHMQIAYDYYALGLKKDDADSLAAIIRLAQAGNSEAQYLLGVEHYHKKNKVDEAIHWCMLAAESKHANAITYLNNTTFTVVQYTTIASSYAAGTGVAKNETSAVVFYKKACTLKSIAAAMYLGQYYQPNLTVAYNPQAQQTGKNVTDSFNYYCVAAEQGNVQAMEAMAKLTEYANDDALRLRLAILYLNVLANPQLAFKHLKILADKNHSAAIKQINTLIESNPQHIAIIAKLYEEDVALKNHMQKACDYYAVGLKKDDASSFAAVTRLAQAGNSEAQYLLGVEHYHRKNKVDEAIHWCMLAADSKHANAITYLNNTTFTVVQYTTIASSYAAGTRVAKNEASAVVFYKKACALKNKIAAIYLGQHYQPDITVAYNPQTQQTGKNVTDSFNYYYVAAEQGDADAIEAMAKLTEYTNDDALRLRLAMLYLNVFANPKLAFKHLKILADKNHSEAVKQIKTYSLANPEYAFILAELYEEDKTVERYLEKACYCYIMALNRNSNCYKAAVQQLNTIFESNILNANELINIGKFCYSPNSGIKIDADRAILCFEMAYKKGESEAYYHLASMYHHGSGVTKNLFKAIRYYQPLAAAGHEQAQTEINSILNSSTTTLKELISIADMLQNGSGELTADPAQAIKFYQKASERGDAPTALLTAQLLQLPSKGSSTVDKEQAFKAYLKAARMGHPDALIPLERLGEEVSAQNQMELSNLYGSFFKNQEKANYWRTQALQVASFTFK